MAWELLFKSDVGLLSLLTIVGVIGIAVFFVRYVAQQAEKDSQRQAK